MIGAVFIVILHKVSLLAC